MAVAFHPPERLRRSGRLMAPREVLENPLLSIVMPVYNEAETVDEIFQRVTTVPLRTELIVVDDGSTDGTREKLAALQQRYGFKYLPQPKNMGKGAAIRR